MRYHSPPIGTHGIQTEPPGFSYTAGGNTRVQPLRKTDWHAPTICDPAIMLLGIDPNQLKTHPHKSLHKDAYSSFIHNCKHSETTNISSGKLLNNLSIEYYSVLNINELLPMERENLNAYY